MNSAKQIPISGYWNILSRYVLDKKWQFWLLAFLMISSISMQVFNPQIMRSFIDNAMAGKPTFTLMLSALLFMSVALVQQAVAVATGFIGENVAWYATNALRADLARHALMLDMSFHNDKSPGEFIERIEGDVSEFSTFFSQLVLKIVGNLLLLVFILVALFRENMSVGWVFTGFSIVTVLALYLIRSVAVPFQKALRDAQTALFAFLEESLAGTEDIRSCGAVDFVLSKLFDLQTLSLRCWRAASEKQFLVRVTAGLMLCVGMSSAFFLGFKLHHAGVLTIGTVYLIVYYTGLLARPIRELTQQVESMQNIGASVERMNELLSVKHTIVDGPSIQSLPDGPLKVSFSGVSFGYAQDEPIIRDLSFACTPGSVLGLLGRTGSGKTTLARLALRLYEGGEGAICLGGVDVRSISLRELRKRVAIVTQDVQLFQASVRDNLTFFDKTVSDERLHAIIDALELGDWFRRLPNGLDTRLQTGGKGLSAGEAQLLAFSRVFLRNPGLVILDEASSRLDPATERLVERAIDHLLENRTAIIIAHRLGTLHRADSILILDHGRVGEFGERTSLLADPLSLFSKLNQSGLQSVLA